MASAKNQDTFSDAISLARRPVLFFTRTNIFATKTLAPNVATFAIETSPGISYLRTAQVLLNPFAAA